MLKHRLLLIGIGAVLLVGLIGIGSVTARTANFAILRDLATTNGAQQAPADAPAPISVPADRLTVPGEQEVRQITPTDEPAPTSVPMDRLAATDEQDAIRQAIQALVTQWSETMVKGEGWLHVVTHHVRDKEESSPLPNGQTIPLNYISDTWYHLNHQSQAVEVIAFMRSEDGDPVQISTFRDNTWRNLTVAEQWEGAPYAPRLDLGFSADANRAHEWGCTLNQQTTTLAGQPVSQFTLREEFESPLQMQGYAQPAVAAERRASFDAHSGAVLLVERVLVTAEGEDHVVKRAVPITTEYGVVPPAEVLALLQQEVIQ